MILAGLLGMVLAGTAAAEGTICDFTMDTIDGQPQPLAAYKGQVLLVVNTASRCGLTKQYAGLQELHEKYKDRGLTVLGFPANNFGGQEPGTNEQIQQFCTTKFSVTFPMFSKISVKGDDVHPLYVWLVAQPGGRPVGWNFTKFLIGRDGRLAASFASRTAPDAPEIAAAIEAALNKPAE